MQRIEAFLREPEVPDWASSLKSTAPQTSDRIGFEEATFEWDVAPRSEPSRFRLGPLDLTFPKGQLSLISGPTGSGKSALLNALLGGASPPQPVPNELLTLILICARRDDLLGRSGVVEQGGPSGRILCAEPM